MSMNDHPGDRGRLLKYYFNPTTTQHHQEEPMYPPPPDALPQAQPAKCRRVTRRVVPVTREMVESQIGLPVRDIRLNHNQLHCPSPFNVFMSNLLTYGTLLWRIHLPNKDVFCMNSYDADGKLMPQHFVHTTREKLVDGSILYQCSCSAYNLIHSVLLHHHHSENDEEVLPEGAACMHCKFFNNFF